MMNVLLLLFLIRIKASKTEHDSLTVRLLRHCFICDINSGVELLINQSQLSEKS